MSDRERIGTEAPRYAPKSPSAVNPGRAGVQAALEHLEKDVTVLQETAYTLLARLDSVSISRPEEEENTVGVAEEGVSPLRHRLHVLALEVKRLTAVIRDKADQLDL